MPKVHHLLLLVTLTSLSFAVEHPGTIGTALCTSCHADKLRGKSVHSAMASSCNVCHVARTQGDMTTIVLAMPKERICSACHVETDEVKRHRQQLATGTCVSCHDPHSSRREMLLRVAALAPVRTKGR